VSADLVAAAVVAALCAGGGLLVPLLVARTPEPEPVEDGDPKTPYAEIAARPRLAARSALASGLAGGVVGLAVGWAWPLLFLVPLVPVCVALAVIDWHTKLLPTRIVLPALGVTVLLSGVVWLAGRDTDALIRALVGLAAVRSLFWLLWFVRASGMGFGDVRLSALLGFVLGHLGWGELVVGVYAGFLVFGLPGLVVAVVRRDRQLLRRAFPFGPFMVVGALTGIALGPAVWARLVTG
jgi:leader peptidase (prepilin peptidase)/N-methyltransferase